jgi:hypothetical protein
VIGPDLSVQQTPVRYRVFWYHLGHSRRAGPLSFSVRRRETEASLRSVFFHEDDYCQVEILPANAHGYCLREMGQIDQFADAHRDGPGFTDVYMRGEPPAPLSSLGATLADLRSTIGAVLAPFDQVFTGYSSHREPCGSVHAWDIDDSAAVFAKIGEADVVQSVWFSLHGVPTEEIGEWCRALACLPHAFEMILTDWNSRDVLLLKVDQRLALYLRGYHA